MHLSIEDTIAQTTQNVQRSSNPSDLKITDTDGFVVAPGRFDFRNLLKMDDPIKTRNSFDALLTLEEHSRLGHTGTPDTDYQVLINDDSN